MITLECDVCGQFFQVTKDAYQQRIRRQSFGCRDCYQSGAKGYDNEGFWKFICAELGLHGSAGRLTAI
jgi:hypothetical protein